MTSKERTTLVDEYEVKVVLLGESGVGKSSIVLRFVTGNFRPNTVSTIGASFMSKVVLEEQGAIKYQIWDTAGQEKYRSLASMYYKNADAALLIYDITNTDSLEQIRDYWYEELRNNVLAFSSIPILLVGNKSDLEKRREVTYQQGQDMCDELGCSTFLETSAAEDTNITELFSALSQNIDLQALTSGRRSESSLTGTNPFDLSSFRQDANGIEGGGTGCC